MFAAKLNGELLHVGEWDECAAAASAAHNSKALVCRATERDLAEFRAECSALFQLSSTASVRYKVAFQGAVEQARKVRGHSAEDESFYAQGYLPKGFGVYGESRFLKRGRTRHTVCETGDAWYRALRVD